MVVVDTLTYRNVANFGRLKAVETHCTNCEVGTWRRTWSRRKSWSCPSGIPRHTCKGPPSPPV